jgi:hypothetical protein
VVPITSGSITMGGTQLPFKPIGNASDGLLAFVPRSVLGVTPGDAPQGLRLRVHVQRRDAPEPSLTVDCTLDRPR